MGKNNILVKIGAVLGGLAVAAASFLGFGGIWGLTFWGKLDLDEIIFQLQNPLQGTEKGILLSYFFRGLLPVLVILFLYVLFLYRVGDNKKRLIFIAGSVSASALFVLVVGSLVWTKLGVGTWLEGQNNVSTFIEEEYRNPATVQISFPEKKRNLVYIYLESMEVTSADVASGGAFPVNVIPELTKIAQENEDFSGDSEMLNGGYAYSGTTFTTGAMFAATAGLPLKIGIGGNNMDTQDSFFPEIVTLGDLLHDAGYRQVLLLGSKAKFGGRQLLYEDHGDFEIRDLKYAKKRDWIPSDYHVWWGYEDEKLFSFAKETLLELAQGDEPFHLTMLTVDGHAQDGYVCRLCENAFEDNQYANVMACTSRQTAAFIEWLQAQDFYADTTVVISGDHPTMDHDYCSQIPAEYEQKTYTAILNAAVEPAQKDRRREFSTMDLFPTTLGALGVQIEGNRLGLGTNLFSATDTLTETYGNATVRREINNRSLFLEELEKTDENAEDLIERYQKEMQDALTIEEIDPVEGKVRIRMKVSFSSTVDYQEFEALYQETGAQETTGRILLEPDPENPTSFFTGILDVSSWSGMHGKVWVNMTLTNGQRCEKLTEAQIEE